MHPKWHIVSIFLLIEIFTQISVFRLVFFRCHSVSPKWGFHKRFRCPIALPDRLAQLNVLLLCNHIVHYIRLSFLFQSSLPQGERRSKVDQFLDLVKISIHAPTRGATHVVCIPFKKHLGFQSTLPRGERHVRVIKYSILVPNFNPRSHEGSDQVKNNNINIKEDFNPRSHEGSDALALPTWYTFS